uniref:Putative secreted peptide n=1 Tax=Anopheles braziliensis TaxID=58242 RepID=A0A2M3ZXE6_9DIPT
MVCFKWGIFLLIFSPSFAPFSWNELFAEYFKFVNEPPGLGRSRCLKRVQGGKYKTYLSPSQAVGNLSNGWGVASLFI